MYCFLQNFVFSHEREIKESEVCLLTVKEK